MGHTRGRPNCHAQQSRQIPAYYQQGSFLSKQKQGVLKRKNIQKFRSLFKKVHISKKKLSNIGLYINQLKVERNSSGRGKEILQRLAQCTGYPSVTLTLRCLAPLTKMKPQSSLLRRVQKYAKNTKAVKQDAFLNAHAGATRTQITSKITSLSKVAATY